MTHARATRLFWTSLLAVLAASGPRQGGGQETTTPRRLSPGELEAAKTAEPLSPAASLAKLRPAPGVRVELAAAEPQVVDPVAIRFDEAGRMWVVEMSDYPLGPPLGEPPLSRIKILTDRDGDGYFETSALFADQLPFATGLQPYRHGVFVTYAGTVAWLADEDGDGSCDVRQPWFQGFAEENSQLRANRPTFTIEGWIDVANGLRGGAVVAANRPQAAPLSISGMDFRFHPRSGDFQALTGVGQFGLTHDDFGRRFVCSNRNPLKHIVLEHQYLARAPNVAVAAAAHDVAVSGEASRIFPLTRGWTTSTLHAGQFTAACGVLVYRGNALPFAYGDAFTCDPTGNLVHREILQPRGATFTSQPARKGAEFLASEDEWFRPVNLSLGPDGALYVVDMYRAVIEHPQFMPEELQSRPDLRWGDDRGRVYRLAAEPGQAGAAVGPPDPPLHRRGPAEWTAALRSPNAWVRDTAARLIAQGDADLASLRRLAADPSAGSPGRAHALWLLQQHGQMTEELLRGAMADADAGIRETALRIAEPMLRNPPDPAPLRAALLPLLEDESPRVRFQAMLSLAPLLENEMPRLNRAAALGVDDPWQRAAARLAASAQPQWLLHSTLASAADSPRLTAGVGWLGSELISDLPKQLDAASVWSSLAPVLQRHPRDPEAYRLLLGWLRRYAAGKPPGQLVGELPGTSLESIQGDLQAAALEADPDVQDLAWQCLAYFPDAAPFLTEQAGRDDAAPQSRTFAARALARHGQDSQWRDLLARAAQSPPPWKHAVIDACLARAGRAAALLDTVEKGALRAADIDPLQTRRLVSHADEQIRQRAGKLLSPSHPDRDAVLAEYQKSLELTPDLLEGRVLFRKLCTTCHRIGEDGVDVAPDIADSRTKSPLQLLTDIIQPNRAVDANFMNYIVQTVEGEVVSGVIAEENASAVTLRQPGDKRVVVKRDQIELLQSTGQSLMPEGLERGLSPQDLANLVGYIKNWRYLSEASSGASRPTR